MIYALTFLLGIVTGYLIRYYWKREKGDGVTVTYTLDESPSVEGRGYIAWAENGHPMYKDMSTWPDQRETDQKVREFLSNRLREQF